MSRCAVSFDLGGQRSNRDNKTRFCGARVSLCSGSQCTSSVGSCWENARQLCSWQMSLLKKISLLHSFSFIFLSLFTAIWQSSVGFRKPAVKLQRAAHRHYGCKTSQKPQIEITNQIRTSDSLLVFSLFLSFHKCTHRKSFNPVVGWRWFCHCLSIFWGVVKKLWHGNLTLSVSSLWKFIFMTFSWSLSGAVQRPLHTNGTALICLRPLFNFRN